MKSYLHIFTIFVLLSCNSNKDQILIPNNSVWKFTTRDIFEPEKDKSVKLIFKSDGYAYEVETILNYKWQYVSRNKTLIINNQAFEVIQAKDSVLYMKNETSGLPAKLIKLKN